MIEGVKLPKFMNKIPPGVLNFLTGSIFASLGYWFLLKNKELAFRHKAGMFVLFSFIALFEKIFWGPVILGYLLDVDGRDAGIAFLAMLLSFSVSVVDFMIAWNRLLSEDLGDDV